MKTNNVISQQMKEFEKKFVTKSTLLGSIIGTPEYMGRENQEVEDIKSFLRARLSETIKTIKI